jgi:hypothetical protein
MSTVKVTLHRESGDTSFTEDLGSFPVPELAAVGAASLDGPPDENGAPTWRWQGDEPTWLFTGERAFTDQLEQAFADDTVTSVTIERQ